MDSDVTDKAETIGYFDTLGLTHYESLIFMSLIESQKSALDLSHDTGIPYTKVYNVIEKMESIGLVQKLKSENMIYRIAEPETSLRLYTDILIEKQMKAFKNIVKYIHITKENQKNESGKINGSWNILGIERVKDYIRGEIKNAKRSIYVVDPKLEIIDGDTMDMIASRGDDIEKRLILLNSDDVNIPVQNNIDMRIHSKVGTRYFIFDRSVSFMVSMEEGHEVYGIVEPCSNCVLQSNEHFQMLWENSRPI